MPLQKYREKYRKEGRCCNCGGDLEDDRKQLTLCKKCANKRTITSFKTFHYYQNQGICPYCRKNEILGDEKCCPECRVNIWIQHKEYRKNNPDYVEKVKQSNRKRAEFRRTNHLCVNCGKELKDTSFVNCEKCRIKRRIYAERFRKKILVV